MSYSKKLQPNSNYHTKPSTQSTQSFIPKIQNKSLLTESKAKIFFQEFSLNDIIPSLDNTHNRKFSQPIGVLTPELLFCHKKYKSFNQKPLVYIYDTSATSPREDLETEDIKYTSHSRNITDDSFEANRISPIISENHSRNFFYTTSNPTLASKNPSPSKKTPNILSPQETITSLDLSASNLPVFGTNPCTAYCFYCDKIVHTQVEFSNKTNMASGLLKFVSSIFSCCGEPSWLLKLQVHKCRKCRKILAKSCI
ncbi:hypothetical protein SteCoe_11103 [Stentor coeruleus]|uniref:LITAF domain-containing protein n=1 Tax=Stentor coeruleus TaxID=5963 RepID=A0A1R2CDU7_9CILI|nr:hypothetical protein SteCoe_11103 [Stentor coeruleus]